MSIAYIYNKDCLLHDMGGGHPERPARINAIEEHIRNIKEGEEVIPAQDCRLGSGGRSNWSGHGDGAADPLYSRHSGYG